MEAFQLLSRGGTKFDKTKFKNDVLLFKRGKNAQPTACTTSSQDETMPSELDFFRYAQGTTTKRKAEHDVGVKNKKRRVDMPNADAEVEETKTEGSFTNSQAHRVTAKGSDIPVKINVFEELKERYSVSNRLLANLTKCRYFEPTGIQSHGIPVLIQGRDLAAISPTGTGKTLSYLLPAFARLKAPSASSAIDGSGNGVRALVISPTRELAHQIHNECLKLALGRKWKVILFSKATANALADKNVRDKVDIIISTPLRLVAALQSGVIDLSNVRFLVLDEADRLLDVEFLPQVEEIVAACTHATLQKAAFSATLPAGVEKIAMNMLRDPIRIVVGLKDTPLPLIAQKLTYVADDQSKLPSLIMHLSQPFEPPLLIFTSTQPRAESLAEELILNGVRNVDCLHAGMTNKEREDAVARMRKGESWIMVSTEVMARGMDFKGVREVINYDFPTSIQSYVHRIGRTGRAGREGKAITYFTDEDAPYLKPIATVLSQSGSSVPDWILKLPKPSRMKKKAMGKVSRPEMVNAARKIGQRDALKKRDMINASKRLKERSTPGSGER
ncbi:P-loop containing nucleoside triphosphate hydrolase protein [Amanita rubescens]|nr:P-loop containing nucleoside triphosphate hydrolase protein [Amanita rubescens]